jgi:hypothetical protein
MQREKGVLEPIRRRQGRTERVGLFRQVGIPSHRPGSSPRPLCPASVDRAIDGPGECREVSRRGCLHGVYSSDCPL